MKLVSERLIIREFSYNDLDDYFEFAKNPNVGPMAGWKPVPSKDVARQILAKYMLYKDVFAICLKENNRVIGTMSIYDTGLRKYNKVKQLGFSLNYDYWNQGIMTEAVKITIKYIFTKTDCELIEVGHHSDNYQSKRVIEKCGFLYDGRLSKYKKLYDGRLIDADFYSLTKEEYERMRLNERTKA